MSNVDSALEKASEIAGLVAVAPGPIGVVAKIAAMALKAGSAIASAGKDPVVEIQRILSADPEIARVHAEWDAHIDRLWRQRTERAAADTEDPPADTESSPTASDPYEDA